MLCNWRLIKNIFAVRSVSFRTFCFVSSLQRGPPTWFPKRSKCLPSWAWVCRSLYSAWCPLIWWSRTIPLWRSFVQVKQEGLTSRMISILFVCCNCNGSFKPVISLSEIWAMRSPGWARRPAARWSPPIADTASDSSSTHCLTCRRTKPRGPCRSLFTANKYDYPFIRHACMYLRWDMSYGGADDQPGWLPRPDLARQLYWTAQLRQVRASTSMITYIHHTNCRCSVRVRAADRADRRVGS